MNISNAMLEILLLALSGYRIFKIFQAERAQEYRVRHIPKPRKEARTVQEVLMPILARGNSR